MKVVGIAVSACLNRQLRRWLDVKNLPDDWGREPTNDYLAINAMVLALQDQDKTAEDIAAIKAEFAERFPELV